MSQREMGDERYADAMQECLERERELRAYSMMLRPRLSIDGDQWCALYGENLQDGVAGFGASPYLAFRAFDRAWEKELLPRGTPPAKEP